MKPDRLADLANNAERRTREGKFDDAVGRLYRLTEMLAQYELRMQHKMDTGDVPLKRFSELPDLASKLEKRRANDGKIKVGLQDAYEMLAALGSELGRQFREAGKLSKLLAARNQSILAHGHVPIERQQAIDMLVAVKDLALGGWC